MERFPQRKAVMTANQRTRPNGHPDLIADAIRVAKLVALARIITQPWFRQVRARSNAGASFTIINFVHRRQNAAGISPFL
jgi:hypothetical protein